ncbi:hypothetical protein AB0333_07695 [Citricoccus sp. NPDC079358]|uniref:hypothetical protein n=1 Tax=Micrococcaceae TaxID=1268 RepID=UPI00128EDABC|nr:hypothetical protein [Kocuria rhizophila]
MELVSWVGMAGTVLAFVLFLPQARHAWTNQRRPERLRGISVTGQVCVIANALVWGLYAFLTGAFWTGAPGIINTAWRCARSSCRCAAADSHWGGRHVLRVLRRSSNGCSSPTLPGGDR